MSEIKNKEGAACGRLGAVGGQAVLEGIMMRNGDDYAVGVRRSTGEISIAKGKFTSVRKKFKILDLPIIRGSVNMIESMVLSYRTLETSAEQFGLEEDDGTEPSKFDKWLDKHFGDKLMNVVMVISMIFGVALSLGLFLFLPSAMTKLLEHLIGVELGWWKNAIEGALKIVIFILYLLLTSLMKDIRRTFEYHGAEHKTIFCYESGEELTPENVKKYQRFHPRCGTSFLFIIIILNIFIYSLPIFSWHTGIRFATKLLTLPLVVGIGYEFLRFAGKHPNPVTNFLSIPGLLMQRITTREPDEGQIEVAIHALKAAMPNEFPDFVPQLIYVKPEKDGEQGKEDKEDKDGVETDASSSETVSAENDAVSDGASVGAEQDGGSGGDVESADEQHTAGDTENEEGGK